MSASRARHVGNHLNRSQNKPGGRDGGCCGTRSVSHDRAGHRISTGAGHGIRRETVGAACLDERREARREIDRERRHHRRRTRRHRWGRRQARQAEGQGQGESGKTGYGTARRMSWTERRGRVLWRQLGTDVVRRVERDRPMRGGEADVANTGRTACWSGRCSGQCRLRGRRRRRHLQWAVPRGRRRRRHLQWAVSSGQPQRRGSRG